MSTNKVSVQAEGKNTIIAYALWWFLGSLGIHRMYLGRTGSGVAQLMLMIFGIITLYLGVGFLLLLILGIWWLIDAFLTYGIVKEENEKQGLSSSGIVLSNLNNSSDLDTLAKLHDLREKGILTEQEYQDKKSEII